MPKVIVLDKLSQEGLDLLAKAPGIEHEVRTGLKGEALRSALAECDGAICRSGVKITADVLEGKPNAYAHRFKWRARGDLHAEDARAVEEDVRK